MEINLVNETVYWDSVVKQIVEVPSDYVQRYWDSIFLSGSNRDRITYFLEEQYTEDKSFNEKFQINTYNNTIKQ
jgi:hypothetical protein